MSSRKFWFFHLPKFIPCHSADLSLFGPGEWGCQGRAGFARRSVPLTTPPAKPYPRYKAEWLALSPRPAVGVSRLPHPRLLTDLTHIPCFYSHSLLSQPMWLGARWVSILMSRRCHLSHDLTDAQFGVLGLDQDHWRSHRTLGFPQFRLSLIECRCSQDCRSCFISDLQADCRMA